MDNDEKTLLHFDMQDQNKIGKKIPTVSIISGNEQGKIFSLKERITFGRDESADIVINDKLVSRIHFTAQCHDGYFILEDNDSTNGTFIEGFRDESLQEAVNAVKIMPGAVVRLGSTKLAFSYKSQSDINKEAELYKSALYDGLTGVSNRTWFIKRANEEIEFSRAGRLPLSLAMIDIDFFKKVNDTYGHQAGDTVLCKLAEILSDEKRPRDILGRYGGEEFILMLVNTAAADAVNVCERIRNRVKSSVFTYKDTAVNITISAGLSSNAHLKNPALEEMIKAADKFLYKAKKNGRNQVVCR